MIEMKVIDYQPGTGTRYDLVVGVIDNEEDARALHTDIGCVFVAWKGQGSWNFSPAVGVDYIVEKLKLGCYEYDAQALQQLVRHIGGKDTSPGWPICEHCDLPFHKKREDSVCMCQKYPR